MPDPVYVVLLPVKPPAQGKSRLDVDPAQRRALAAAFALDTARACLAAAHVTAVLAVTDDARFADDLRSVGCDTIPDGVTGDLNESLRQAAAEAARRWPGTVPVAVCADLPALVPADLDAVLDDAILRDAGHGDTPAPRGSFLADHDGVGTTLYTAPYDAFAPRFGRGSRQAHLDLGAHEIGVPAPSARMDVDDRAALDEAEAMGLGAHTRLALLG